MTSNEYVGLPPELQRVHRRVDNVKDDLEKETIERKENDKLLFEKFDNINRMIIYQLAAAVSTLIVIIFK